MRVTVRVVGLLIMGGAALWFAAGCNEASEPTDPAAPVAVDLEAPIQTVPPEARANLAPPEPESSPAPPPEPLLPDLRILEPSGFYMVDQRPSGDRRLKFTTTIWNAGPGPVEVIGHEDPATGELAVQQMLHSDAGTVPGGFVGTFQFDHRHGHLHLGGFARYELWSLGEDDQLGELVAQNQKVGFCLMDNIVVDEDLAESQGGPVYPIDCEADVQGISPGYGDVYVAQLYEQDIVITDLPDGRYALLNYANPNGDILEADYDNNVEMAYVTIDGRRVFSD